MTKVVQLRILEFGEDNIHSYFKQKKYFSAGHICMRCGRGPLSSLYSALKKLKIIF